MQLHLQILEGQVLTADPVLEIVTSVFLQLTQHFIMGPG